MERAEAKGCRKDDIICWWHDVKIWKKEKILVLLGLGQLVCYLEGLPVQEEHHL